MGLLRCKLFFFCLIRLWYSLCITLLAKKVYKCKDKCTVFSVHSLYNSFKDLQIRRPSLETAFDCNKICLLKLEEQRQPHTLNCPTITLSAELSCAHTLLCIWHFDSLTLCVFVAVGVWVCVGLCACVMVSVCVCSWTSECDREGDARVDAYMSVCRSCGFRGWAVLHTKLPACWRRRLVFVALTSWDMSYLRAWFSLLAWSHTVALSYSPMWRNPVAINVKILNVIPPMSLCNKHTQECVLL